VRSKGQYSSNDLEGKFLELRLHGVVRSSLWFGLVTFAVTFGRRSSCRVVSWRKVQPYRIESEERAS
jgi:hypothetical protein